MQRCAACRAVRATASLRAAVVRSAHERGWQPVSRCPRGNWRASRGCCREQGDRRRYRRWWPVSSTPPPLRRPDHPRAYKAMIRSLNPFSRVWPLRTTRGSQVPLRSRGSVRSTAPISVSTVFPVVPPRLLPLPWPPRVVVLIAQVAGHLHGQRPLQHRLGHLGQQPIRAEQLEALIRGVEPAIRGAEPAVAVCGAALARRGGRAPGSRRRVRVGLCSPVNGNSWRAFPCVLHQS